MDITKFNGLDLRRLPETWGGSARLIDGTNVRIMPGNSIQSRPQLRLHATVDASTFGLYAVGAELRTAYPQGAGAVPRPPNGVQYDVFSDTLLPAGGVDGTNGTAVELANASVWEGRPYLVIGRQPTALPGDNVKYEHHFMPASPLIPVPCTVVNPTTLTVTGPVPPGVQTGSTLYFTSPGDTLPHRVTLSGSTLTLGTATALTGAVVCMIRPYGGTRVSTPFAPGRALTLVGTKFFASDIDTNNVPFSSTVNGPTDWTNPGDAGALPTSVHIGGNQRVQGHGVFNGQLVVLYDESMQVWKVGADPALHALVGNVGGAGTRMPRSIVNVMGDVLYFSNGGFHSVSSVVTTGQLKADDIGIMIRKLTDRLDPRTQTILAGWSEALSCYYAIVGQTVYVYTLSPSSQTRDWTTWTLPWEVSDTAEVNGQLYVRRAGTGEVYVFDDAYTGEVGFAWSATTNFLDGSEDAATRVPNAVMRVKKWGHFRANQEGEALWQAVLDPNNLAGSTADLGTVVGSFTDAGLVYIGLNANRLAFRMSGTGYWNIDQLHVQMTVGNHV